MPSDAGVTVWVLGGSTQFAKVELQRIGPGGGMLVQPKLEDSAERLLFLRWVRGYGIPETEVGAIVAPQWAEPDGDPRAALQLLVSF